MVVSWGQQQEALGAADDDDGGGVRADEATHHVIQSSHSSRVDEASPAKRRPRTRTSSCALLLTNKKMDCTFNFLQEQQPTPAVPSGRLEHVIMRKPCNACLHLLLRCRQNQMFKKASCQSLTVALLHMSLPRVASRSHVSANFFIAPAVHRQTNLTTSLAARCESPL